MVLPFVSYNYIHHYIGKYNCGKRVDGVWVFGGVERGTGRCFLLVVQNRTATTLLAFIKEWIKPGTTIISDCWKSYDMTTSSNFYLFYN
jgi:transposase-like protein